MSPIIIGLLVLVVTLLVLATGLPIAFGLGAVALLFMVMFDGWGSVHYMVETVFAGLDDFTLVSLFALAGYVLSMLAVPIPPLVLALILGGMTEESYRNAITISNGTLEIFYQKPISLAFLVLAFISLAYGLLKQRRTAEKQA